jgi:hypothetical protein
VLNILAYYIENYSQGTKTKIISAGYFTSHNMVPPLRSLGSFTITNFKWDFGKKKQKLSMIQYDLTSIFMDAQHFQSITETLRVDNTHRARRIFTRDKMRFANIERKENNEACVKFVQVEREYISFMISATNYLTFGNN